MTNTDNVAYTDRHTRWGQSYQRAVDFGEDTIKGSNIAGGETIPLPAALNSASGFASMELGVCLVALLVLVGALVVCVVHRNKAVLIGFKEPTEERAAHIADRVAVFDIPNQVQTLGVGVEYSVRRVPNRAMHLKADWEILWPHFDDFSWSQLAAPAVWGNHVDDWVLQRQDRLKEPLSVKFQHSRRRQAVIQDPQAGVVELVTYRALVEPINGNVANDDVWSVRQVEGPPSSEYREQSDNNQWDLRVPVRPIDIFRLAFSAVCFSLTVLLAARSKFEGDGAKLIRDFVCALGLAALGAAVWGPWRLL